jgi:hypothetical protein
MSLWSLPLEALTFEQLDEFLAARLPEGSRLDYKLDVPNDLAKVIAAFANTLGGLIVLGVEEDTKTTQPVWPPDPAAGKGMPMKRGLREQITQIARDAIYPPVNVRISPVIENKYLPGKALLAVRVDESREAPHAVEKGREVYVYERDGSTTPPYRLAEVDRIAYLLQRRRSIEDDREHMLDAEIDRARGLLEGGHCPLRWASVIPVYPWRSLCQPALCHQLQHQLPTHQGARYVVRQQMPDGAYVRGVRHGAAGEDVYVSCKRVNSKGLIFHMEMASELTHESELWLELSRVVALLQNIIAEASTLYRHKSVELPGILTVSIGMIGVRDAKLICGPTTHRGVFPDNAS